MQDEEQDAFLLRGQLKSLQRAGQGDALKGHDESQDNPSVRSHYVASEFFSEMVSTGDMGRKGKWAVVDGRGWKKGG